MHTDNVHDHYDRLLLKTLKYGYTFFSYFVTFVAILPGDLPSSATSFPTMLLTSADLPVPILPVTTV